MPEQLDAEVGEQVDDGGLFGLEQRDRVAAAGAGLEPDEAAGGCLLACGSGQALGAWSSGSRPEDLATIQAEAALHVLVLGGLQQAAQADLVWFCWAACRPFTSASAASLSTAIGSGSTIGDFEDPDRRRRLGQRRDQGRELLACGAHVEAGGTTGGTHQQHRRGCRR
ncbi:MAG: hypothetical protein U0Q03_06935 [Acidimicrobiales bacterium]